MYCELGFLNCDDFDSVKVDLQYDELSLTFLLLGCVFVLCR